MLPLHIFCFFAVFVPYLMPLSGGTTSLVERGRWCRSDMEMIRRGGGVQKLSVTSRRSVRNQIQHFVFQMSRPPLLWQSFWDLLLFSSVVWCTKYWRAGKLKYLRKCIKFKIRRNILQQEQTLQSIEDDDGQPKLFFSSLWYVSRESPLNLKACEFLIDFIWWIEIEILMSKFLYLGQFSKFWQTLHFLVR